MPLFISEYSSIAIDSRSQPAGMPVAPPFADHRLPIDSQSVQSPVWGASTSFVQVHATEPCCLAFGEDPEAESDKHYVAAGETRYYGIHAGHRLAVIGAGD